MKKNFFDRMSDSYENFHFKNTEIKTKNRTIAVSPKLKLILGWSLFILLCVLGWVVSYRISHPGATNLEKKKQSVLKKDVSLDEEHDTIVPYEKNADKELNAFIEKYFEAIVDCNHIALQDMVTDPSEFRSDDLLKKKAEFITGYNNITVYTKVGYDEGSYIAFVVSNVNIVGVNSAPFDITTLYIVNGARGYLIHNGNKSLDTQEYIEKVKGDKDIQKIYRSIEKENEKLKEKDKSLVEFFEIISKRNIEVDSAAEILGTQEEDSTKELEP